MSFHLSRSAAAVDASSATFIFEVITASASIVVGCDATLTSPSGGKSASSAKVSAAQHDESAISDEVDDLRVSVDGGLMAGAAVCLAGDDLQEYDLGVSNVSTAAIVFAAEPFVPPFSVATVAGSKNSGCVLGTHSMVGELIFGELLINLE